MGSIFNQDFLEFIDELNRCEVEYLLVGGYAVVLYGYHRSTGDMDIWVNPTTDNYKRLMKAFRLFGLPLNAISEKDFLNTKDFDVFTFGRTPVCIDIMTKVKGLDFLEAYPIHIVHETEGTQIKVIHYNSLIITKEASGRLKDQNDILHLEEE